MTPIPTHANPSAGVLGSLAVLAWLAMSATAQTILFQDGFGAGGSLTDPAARATGTLASTVKYAWTNSTDVAISGGILTWDNNNTRNGWHQQIENGEGTTTQNFRITYNLAPQVAGKVWEVEFDQRVGWSHPLTFGLSDVSRNGNWSAWNDTNYDFAVGSYGTNLFHDADNDGGGTNDLNNNTTSVGSVFPILTAASPPTNQMHHFRIRFDEPNGKATVWINGVLKVQTSIDFENAGRYLSWGEPLEYAGALDNLTVSIINPTPPAITLITVSGNTATITITGDDSVPYYCASSVNLAGFTTEETPLVHGSATQLPKPFHTSSGGLTFDIDITGRTNRLFFRVQDFDPSP